MQVNFNSIGIIHTPFTSREGMPIQPSGADGIKGTIELNNELQEGLSDLEGFSHILLIYCFHQSEGFELRVTPFLDNQSRGIFSTRAPKRPNQIGISVVRLLSIKGNILKLKMLICLTAPLCLISNLIFLHSMCLKPISAAGMDKT